MNEANPINTSVDRLRLESTSSRSTGNHDLINFDDVLAKDDIRRSMTLQQSSRSRPRTHSSASNKSQKKSSSSSGDKKKQSASATAAPVPSADQRSLYERIIGKTPLVTAPIKPSPSQPIKNSIFGWFTKETTEERAIKSTLKNYRNKLQQEIQYTTKSLARYQRKTADQIAEYERQERQLISWGLKTAIPKFHLQAWYRIERGRLYEKLAEEIGSVIDSRQRKAQTYLQNFEESSNRRNKFSISSTEEFCISPEKLILQDASVLMLQDRLKRMDILYGFASKQFMQLEPEFEWKDQKDRKKEFYRILSSYNELPKPSELDNIESDLSWKSFCNWMAERSTKQKKIEQDYFDFIEDSREVEGRLFQRWQTCVLLSLSSSSMMNSVDRSASDSSDQQTFRETPLTSSAAGEGNEFRSARPAPLKVTAASIRAFIQYFASDIIGVKYTIPRDCQAANKALAEALFYRRIAPYVFRYQDNHQRRMDDYWRIQCQRCRYVDPKCYYVIQKYLVKKEVPIDPPATNNSGSAAAAAVSTADNVKTAPNSSSPSPTSEAQSSLSANPTYLALAGRGGRKGSQSSMSKNNSSSNVGGNNSSSHPPPCMCYYCQTLSLSQQLQRLPVYEDGMRGEHFARSARVLSWLRFAVTPREMAVYLTLACKWILRDAIDVSGSRSIIGADEMVPLFTMILVHAQIPNIHMILRILTDFGEYDEQGDVSYCIANMEGSMRFLMDFSAEEIPAEIHQMFHQTPMFASIVQSVVGTPATITAMSPPVPAATGAVNEGVDNVASLSTSPTSDSNILVQGNYNDNQNNTSGSNLKAKAVAERDSMTASGAAEVNSASPMPVNATSFITSKPPPIRTTIEAKKYEDAEAMEQLGEWLRDQKTMEDTIAILQSDGWML